MVIASIKNQADCIRMAPDADGMVPSMPPCAPHLMFCRPHAAAPHTVISPPAINDEEERRLKLSDFEWLADLGEGASGGGDRRRYRPPDGEGGGGSRPRMRDLGCISGGLNRVEMRSVSVSIPGRRPRLDASVFRQSGGQICVFCSRRRRAWSRSFEVFRRWRWRRGRTDARRAEEI
jgi:hypothetical protein